MNALSDKQFDAVRGRLNAAIHEVVFACHHADEDRLEDALNALMTAQGTLEEVAQELVDLAGD